MRRTRSLLFAGFLGVLTASASAFAAGPFDGRWVGDSTEQTVGCTPYKFQLAVKDTAITGTVGGRRMTTPITGTIAAGGKAKLKILDADAEGTFTRDTFELRWFGQCGARVARGKKV